MHRYPGYERLRRQQHGKRTVSTVEAVRDAMTLHRPEQDGEDGGRSPTHIPQDPQQDNPPRAWCDEELEHQVRLAFDRLFEQPQHGSVVYTLVKQSDGNSDTNKWTGYNTRMRADLSIHPVQVNNEMRFEVKATVQDGEAPEQTSTAGSPSTDYPVLMDSRGLQEFELWNLLHDARERAVDRRRQAATNNQALTAEEQRAYLDGHGPRIAECGHTVSRCRCGHGSDIRFAHLVRGRCNECGGRAGESYDDTRLTVEQMQSIRQRQVLTEGMGDALKHGYRKADDTSPCGRNCGNCHFYFGPRHAAAARRPFPTESVETGRCSMFATQVRADHTCDEWKSED